MVELPWESTKRKPGETVYLKEHRTQLMSLSYLELEKIWFKHKIQSKCHFSSLPSARVVPSNFFCPGKEGEIPLEYRGALISVL